MTTETFVYSISKRFEVNGVTHQLKSLVGTLLNGQEHPCSRPHGHNYVVEIVVRGTTLDKHGMLLDYHDLDVLKKYLERFDHHDLNLVLQIDDPTAETFARRILRWCHTIWPAFELTIAVEETPKTRAEVSLTTLSSSYGLGEPIALIDAIGLAAQDFTGADGDSVSEAIHRHYESQR